MPFQTRRKLLEDKYISDKSEFWVYDQKKGKLVPRLKLSDMPVWTTKANQPLQFDIKAFDPKSKLFLKGIANEYAIDRVSEMLLPQGLEANYYNKNPVMLWQHDHRCPVGSVPYLKPESDGVHFEGWVGDPEAVGGPDGLTKTQIEARSLVAQRIVKAVSVGFIPKQIRMPAYNDQGELVDPAVVELWEMLELSLVSVPCSRGALFDLREGKPDETKTQDIVYPSFPVLGSGGKLVVKP